MNYEQSLEYIHGISWCFCKPGLERIAELCGRLGNPQNSLRFIHVAGTNGKGSFCSMTSSVLIAAGYKTGTFTSPYIRFFNERMQINGQPISDSELAEITTLVRPIADEMKDKPTEFELITAIAFMYFKKHNCDIVVLEAGMGGRLDSTNIIETPLLSVITGIALDHTAFLGDTIPKIAAEKAGIIKNTRPVLYGGEDNDAADVIESAAKQRNSEYFRVDYSKLTVKSATLDGTEFDFDSRKDVRISLLGTYQPRNAAVVLSAIDILRKGGMHISEQAVLDGLAAATWQARFEILAKDPLVIFDGAHNPQGIDSAVQSIKQYFGENKVCVLTGVLKDKDYNYIASRLATVAVSAFTMTPDNPRALTAKDYAATLAEYGVKATACDSLAEAYTQALAEARLQNVPLVCLGSLYTYSELVAIM